MLITIHLSFLENRQSVRIYLSRFLYGVDWIGTLRWSTGSSVKGGHIDFPWESVYKSKALWAQQIVQPFQLPFFTANQHGLFSSLYLLVDSRLGDQVYNT